MKSFLGLSSGKGKGKEHERELRKPPRKPSNDPRTKPAQTSYYGEGSSSGSPGWSEGYPGIDDNHGVYDESMNEYVENQHDKYTTTPRYAGNDTLPPAPVDNSRNVAQSFPRYDDPALPPSAQNFPDSEQGGRSFEQSEDQRLEDMGTLDTMLPEQGYIGAEDAQPVPRHPYPKPSKHNPRSASPAVAQKRSKAKDSYRASSDGLTSRYPAEQESMTNARDQLANQYGEFEITQQTMGLGPRPPAAGQYGDFEIMQQAMGPPSPRASHEDADYISMEGYPDATGQHDDGTGVVDTMPLKSVWDVEVHLWRKDGETHRAKGFRDTGNFAGPMVLMDTVLELGYTLDNIDSNMAFKFDTLGGPVKTMGEIQLKYWIKGLDEEKKRKGIRNAFNILESGINGIQVWLTGDGLHIPSRARLSHAATSGPKWELTQEEKDEQRRIFAERQRQAEEYRMAWEAEQARQRQEKKKKQSGEPSEPKHSDPRHKDKKKSSAPGHGHASGSGSRKR